MSESSVGVTSGAMILEEPEERRAGSHQQAPARGQGHLRCGPCALWPRQQTWLCVVPLFIGFIGLGLSLMLLKWIVVGSVRDYVPTDLVNANGHPIFLSKPSTFPKSFDTTTTTAVTHLVSSTMSSSTAATVVRTRTRPGAHPVSSTTSRGTMPGKQATQGSTTVRHGPHSPVVTTTNAVGTNSNEGTSTTSSKTSNPTVLHDSTQLWTHDRNTKLLAITPTPTHNRRTTPSPTLPPLRSEHFKQCHEKDLTYCLNDGECFVIETLSGSHKHCRCKEGFQGIRCDQFLPKTDSILSDPTEHLGIEFMESKAVYKRQVLSITCITTGISLLGTMCMALYCRNKRRREKLQVHFKEGYNLKNYLVNDPSHKLCLRPHFCGNSAHSQAHVGVKSQSSFTEGIRVPFTQSKDPTGNQNCGDSLSVSSEKSTVAVNCETPPISRGMLKPTGAETHSGPTYQYLQEPEFSDREVESVKGHIGRPRSYQRQNSLLSVKSGGGSKTDAQSCQLDRSPCMLKDSSPTILSSHLFYTSTVPIIPSVLKHEDDTSCMQSSNTDTVRISFTPQEGTITVVKEQQHPPPSFSTYPGKQTQMALLLDEAQEQLQALVHAHRKDSSGDTATSWARETVCILLGNGTSSGGLASNGPTETQLLSSRDTNKDFCQYCK
ncbi:pro-neuregulin-3, membrane-bound isoform isoform X2 [Clupea harengus]|uniref:Pro-neuregulin-3, membrane-bound isoform n=1 Tax=Clupea harengus TaxID=7950 RepID=A0A6P8GGT6_CLUHA|nr:pro-neuregulin-3, membrane-bound isoform isoform X2 [Clupea harengus]